jgi:hypothetical protein
MPKFVSNLTLSLALSLALGLAFLAMAPAATAAELPKCRHIAGFEPKATCEARNQRAQWQAEETARLTANQIVIALEQQRVREAQMQDGEDGGIIEVAKGMLDGFVAKVKSLF